MISALKKAAASLLIGMFLLAPAATSAAKEKDDDATDGSDKHSAPEIHPVAAGAVGILVVGGIALLTTRRRTHAAKI